MRRRVGIWRLAKPNAADRCNPQGGVGWEDTRTAYPRKRDPRRHGPRASIFTVAADASGFKFEVGDGNPFGGENGYVDLGVSSNQHLTRSTGGEAGVCTGEKNAMSAFLLA